MAYQETDNRLTRWWFRVVTWRDNHISEKTLLAVLSLVVGILSGVAAQLLKWLIHFIQHLLTGRFSVTGANWLYLVWPLVGLVLSLIFVKYVVRDNISHGVTRVLYAISQRKSRLKTRNIYGSIGGAAVTIGFGGSVGAEGPIVLAGSSIGSKVGQAFRLSPKLLMILVGCGAAAGIAGIFRAPIAGMLFTLEVLMIDLTGATVMPLLIASITSATVAYCLEGYSAEFFFTQSEPFLTSKIPYALLLGVFTGFVSLYFSKSVMMMEGLFRQVSSKVLKFCMGGASLALLIFLFPPLYGEGYDSINQLLAGDPGSVVSGTFFYIDRGSAWFLVAFIGAIILCKGFATASTNGAGGVGGTFAPSLFVGALTGYLFAYICNLLPFGMELSCQNFALLGMAGVMAGVMHAPLMGIFLTAEMTGGYELFLPLLIVSTLSYGTVRIFQHYSLYTERLARQGNLMTHQKDKTVLTLLKVGNLIETDFIPVTADMTLGQMVDTVARSHRNLFPVVDAIGQLLGVVLLDDIRNIMFRSDLYPKMHVQKFMSRPPAVIEADEKMDNVMEAFDRTHAWNLPVVDHGRYLGFVSKSKIFNSYRRVLRHYCDD